MHSSTVTLLACLAVASCVGSPPSGEAPAQPGRGAEPSVDGEHLREDSFPPTDRAWAIADYRATYEVLVELEQNAPERLPRADGPQAPVVAALASLDGVKQAAVSAKDVGELLELGDAMAGTFKIYGTRVARGQGYGREYQAIGAAFFRVGVLQLDRILEDLALTPAEYREDPVRLEGLLKMRYGLELAFVGAIISPQQAPNVVEARDVAVYLEPVMAEVAPSLLPEATTALAREVAQLAELGADPVLVATMLDALRNAKPRPIVRDLLEEHRTYAAEHNATVGQALDSAVPAVAVGAEPGGTRFAHPDRPAHPFSAVFDTEPTALTSQSTAEDGVSLTMRALAHRDALGFDRAINCFSRATPRPQIDPPAQARELLEKMGAQDIISIPAPRGTLLEGKIEAQQHGIARIFSFEDRELCVLLAAYPSSLDSPRIRGRAREFMDSVEFVPAERRP